MNILQSALRYFSENTAVFLLIVAVIYFAILGVKILLARKSGKSFTFRWKYVIAFLAIIGISIYCFITGQNLSEFIG